MKISAIIANLLDVFHLTIDEVGDLTDHQIQHLYFAPRKQHGEIDVEQLERKLQKKQERLRRRAEKDATYAARDATYGQQYAAKVNNNAIAIKNDYFDAYKTLFEFQAMGLISKDEFKEKVMQLQEKHKDLWPAAPDQQPQKTVLPMETQEETRAKIECYRLSGLLPPDECDKLLAQLS